MLVLFTILLLFSCNEKQKEVAKDNKTEAQKTTKPEKNISYLMSVSWADDTQGYTLMGTAIEESPDKFQKDPSDTDNSANKALSSIWKFHKITKN